MERRDSANRRDKKLSEIMTLKELYDSDLLKKGDWISREIKEKRCYTIVSGKSGYEQNQDFSSEGEIYGRFIQKNNRIMEVAGQVTDYEVTFKGRTGFISGSNELHKMCNALYSVQKYGIITCCIGDEQYSALSKPRKEKIGALNKSETIEQMDKKYWLANQVIGRTGFRFGMNYIHEGIKDRYYLFDFTNNSDKAISTYTSNVCPWHFFSADNPNLKVLVGSQNNGSSPNEPYKIVFD